MGISEYIYLIRPIRPEFTENILDSEMEIMNQHFGYLQNLIQEGKLLLAGPSLDRQFGVAILTVDSEELAREIMENDPAVKFGVMTAELHPFRVAMLAGRE